MSDEDWMVEAMLREVAEKRPEPAKPAIPNRYHPGNTHGCSCGKRYRTELAAEFCLARGHRTVPAKERS